MKRIEANGLEFAVEDVGNGAPLILLHGANSDRRQYDIFTPHLADGIRAISYDQRDSPDSPYRGSDYGLDEHIDDLIGIVEALGLESAHVMGASYGGVIAMNAAIRSPRHFKSLILGATAPAAEQFATPDLTAIRAQGAEAVERFSLEIAISPESIDRCPELVEETRALLAIRSAESFQRRMRAISGHDVRPQLHKIIAPTLVLVGDSDPLIPIDVARAMADAIPNAVFSLLQGSRHGITIEQRQRTADLVSQHVLQHA